MSRCASPSRATFALSGLLTAVLIAPSAQAQDAPPPSTAYLWGIRRGCQSDRRLEDAALSRIRAVGREIVLLNVPQTPETQSCSGDACAALATSTPSCRTLSGPLLGAEVDELPTASGVVFRVRAWRTTLGASDPRQVAVEHVTCSGEHCGTKLLSEITAKALNQLLDRATELIAPAPTSTTQSFPSAECITPGRVPPAYCEQPFSGGCPEAEAEPTGRMAAAPSGATTLSMPPSSPATGRWEWLPMAATAVSLAGTVTLGVLNESVTVGPDSGPKETHILTPAFWATAGATAVLGITSVALIANRYRREKRAAQSSSSTALLCPLLTDSSSSGKIR